MIVEFIGATGAGKSSLIREILRDGRSGRPIVSIGDVVMDRPGRRWITNPKAVNVVTDLTVWPWFLRTPRHRDIARFAHGRLRRHAPSTFAKLNYLREIVRDVGKQQLAHHAGSGGTVLVDEGALITAYHLFVYSLAPVDDGDLERFAEIVPLPDRVVYVTAPIDVLVSRAMRRPDRRRELAGADAAAISSSISRAVDVFDRLVAIPSIAERTVVVDNADGTEPHVVATTLAEVVRPVGDLVRSGVAVRRARANAVLERRRRALPGGGMRRHRGRPAGWSGRSTVVGRGAVIAFVGSEATGKSTILDLMARWLAETAPVYRVHAGKPPPTPFTYVPHMLLPMLRNAFPDQRLTRVERRYAEPTPAGGGAFPLLFGVRAVMLAFERRALLRRASARAAAGAIVLSDRYPSSRSGAPDSSQLAHLPADDPVRRVLTALETRLYDAVPSPDLVIALTAPLDVTLTRNAERDKTEPEDYVRFRHARSAKLEFDDVPVVRLDTDRPLETVVGDVKDAIIAVTDVGSASSGQPR